MGNETHGECGTGDNGLQGYGVQEVWVAGGMGHMGNGAHKQWRHRGNGVQGVWSTRGMEQMDNGVHVQWGQWVTGVWGTWAMRPTGGMGYRGMGHMGNTVQGVRGTGHMGNGTQ